MFDPRLLTILLTLSFNPRTMEEIPMTTDTPMTIPSTVNPDRILLERRVSTAMRIISWYSPSRIMVSLSQFLSGEQACSHLVPQRRNRVEDGSLPRRVHAKKQPRTRRHHQPRENRPQFHRCRHSNHRRDHLRQHNPHGHAERPANQSHGARFNQKLQQYISPPRSQRLADSNLPRPLRHRDQHDVHDDDAAHNQRNRSNPNHRDKERPT